MGKIRYIADSHFGKPEIIPFDERPFRSVEEMDAVMMKKWNEAVAPDDTVYIIGDFCDDKESRYIDLLEHLNGEKVMILGNHERYYHKISERIRSMYKVVTDFHIMQDGDRCVVMCHYPLYMFPMDYVENAWMLHGHIHNVRLEAVSERIKEMLKGECPAEEKLLYPRGQVVNVGCMMPWMDYAPRTLDEIIAGYRKGAESIGDDEDDNE
ncbi:MAG: metallophosphoesterase family protein [Clostridia bacterium]|nr:metallophosphoesterase family protein [Clostridia bacterium]